MTRMNHIKFAAVCISLLCFTIGCDTDSKDNTDKALQPTEETAATKDMAKLKGDIQALETNWAALDNARDTNALAAFYADDAVSMSNNKPMAVGKAAIRKDIAESLAGRGKGATVAYDVIDVFGDENTVTETGKTTVKDASGKVTQTGKYMAVWEKRNGKYICVADISNVDEKEK